MSKEVLIESAECLVLVLKESVLQKIMLAERQ